jgi:hypothetical protein
MPQRVITSAPEAIPPHPSLLYLLIISQVNRNVELRLGRIIIWLKSEDASNRIAKADGRIDRLIPYKK